MPRGAATLARTAPGPESLVGLFAERVRSLGGRVWLAPGGREEVRRTLLTAIDELVPAEAKQGSPRMVAWTVDELEPLDLAGLLRGAGIGYVPWRREAGETEDAARARLRAASAAGAVGLTTCAWAAAETGTVALYAAPASGRLVSLLPGAHLALVRPTQLVLGIPEGLELLARGAGTSGGLPATVSLVSGPSRSADIEGDISIGVHGPARLGVVVGDW
ncbi:MAG: LUD domain-containing protein [Chloroflexi bacterium]|nr:LUD domain-containing protein [Chloroflexota bacterium]